jgi:hypothetical protein
MYFFFDYSKSALDFYLTRQDLLQIFDDLNGVVVSNADC